MYTIQELEHKLSETQSDFELLKQDGPILSAQDAGKYYDIAKAAPTFILENENGLLACVISSGRGRLDFEAIKNKFGYSELKMADRKKIEEQTGYRVGAIPLVGHCLPCIFDDRLLGYDYVYGGTGNEWITLKIRPQDLKRLNQVVGILA